jgi:hypothetical protein
LIRLSDPGCQREMSPAGGLMTMPATGSSGPGAQMPIALGVGALPRIA